MSYVWNPAEHLRGYYQSAISEEAKLEIRKENLRNAKTLIRLLSSGIFGYILDDEHLCLFRYKEYKRTERANQTMDFFPNCAYYKGTEDHTILFELIPEEVKIQLLEAKEKAFKSAKELKALEEELKNLPRRYEVKLVSNCPFKVGDKIYICRTHDKEDSYSGIIKDIQMTTVVTRLKFEIGSTYEVPVTLSVKMINGKLRVFTYPHGSTFPSYLFAKSWQELEQNYKEFNKCHI